MQPGQKVTPPPTPAPPSPYDFILKDPQKPKRKFGLPAGKTGPLFLAGGALMVLFLVLIFGSMFKSAPSGKDQIIDLMSQAQEVIRVTTANQTHFTDSNNLAFSNTVMTSLASQQVQFGLYLKKIKASASAAQLVTHLNKSTDAALQTAVVNNNFNSAYDQYLENALQKYQETMVALSKHSSKNLTVILNSAYKSNQTLLASPQLANLQPS